MFIEYSEGGWGWWEYQNNKKVKGAPKIQNFKIPKFQKKKRGAITV